MSIRINIVEIIEQLTEDLVDIEVSTDEALKILMQNFKENVEAGAPRSLINEHLLAVQKTLDRMNEMAKLNECPRCGDPTENEGLCRECQ